MNVALVRLDLGVLGVEKGAELGIKGSELVVLKLPGQLV